MAKADVLKLEKLATSVKIAPNTIPKDDELCSACVKGKLHKTYTKELANCKGKAGDLIHSDLCGPIEKSKGGSIYFGTFTDDATQMTFVYLLKSKSASELLARFRD